MISTSPGPFFNVTMPPPHVIHHMVKESGYKAPKELVDALRKTHDRVKLLRASREKTDESRLEKEFHAALKQKVHEITFGDAHPDSLDGVTIENARKEWRAKAAALDQSIKDLCASSHKCIEEIGRGLIPALKALEVRAEKMERKTCAEWRVEYAPGAVVRTVEHVRKHAEQAFNEGRINGWGVQASAAECLSVWLDEFADN